jgi:hypothetical protein
MYIDYFNLYYTKKCSKKIMLGEVVENLFKKVYNKSALFFGAIYSEDFSLKKQHRHRVGFPYRFLKQY